MNFRDYLDSIEDIGTKRSTLLDAIKIEEQCILEYFQLKSENDELRKQLETSLDTSHSRDVDNMIAQVNILHEENQRLKDNFERAKERYREAKRDAENAEIVARKKLNKESQEIRDRVIIISNIVMDKGKQEKPSAIGRFSVTELNNIIASLEIIVDKMVGAGIWDDNEEKPVLSEIHKNTITAKNPRKKVKDSSNVIEEQTSLRGEYGELWN